MPPVKPRPLPNAAYLAVRDRWHAALAYIRAMDQARTIDTYRSSQSEMRHLQLIRAADTYDHTTRVCQATPGVPLSPIDAYRQRVAASILEA